jgi:SAM-dependent methyltransferase
MSDETFPDWAPAPNIRDAPDLYELENAALDPDGHVLERMRAEADWTGRTIVDLGCGTGFWLTRYLPAAREVIGVEPDPELRASAVDRVDGVECLRVVAGSAEHLPLDDGSVDVVPARFAYFFGPGAEPGLAEVGRVLAPGGALVAVDNDHGAGEFAEILDVASDAFASRHGASVDAWWAQRGATRHPVLSQWRFQRRADLEAVLRNEFRDGAADGWLAAHPDRLHITYGFALFVWRPGPGAAAGDGSQRPAA